MHETILQIRATLDALEGDEAQRVLRGESAACVRSRRRFKQIIELCNDARREIQINRKTQDVNMAESKAARKAARRQNPAAFRPGNSGPFVPKQPQPVQSKPVPASRPPAAASNPPARPSPGLASRPAPSPAAKPPMPFDGIRVPVLPVKRPATPPKTASADSLSQKSGTAQFFPKKRVLSP